MTFYRARLQTRSFDFEAFGDSEFSASEALGAGLVRHEQLYDLEFGWADAMIEEIEITPLEFLTPYRDEVPIFRVDNNPMIKYSLSNPLRGGF